MFSPGERIKLGLLSLLLLLMLGLVCFAAMGTYQAVRTFQQRNTALAAGDVSTIRAWMTIHMVAHLYHVPEDYLSRTLDIANPEQIRHFTLDQIASVKKLPVTRLIQTVQHAILDYRKTHPARVVQTPVQYQKPAQKRTTDTRSRSKKPVRKPISRSGTKSRSLATRRT